MSRSDFDNFETVYPTRCEGVCRLGPKVLQLVDGVLGANCPGPQLFSDETVTLQESPGTEPSLTPTIPGDRDRLACANPRLVRALQGTIEKELDNLDVRTVRMEG